MNAIDPLSPRAPERLPGALPDRTFAQDALQTLSRLAVVVAVVLTAFLVLDATPRPLLRESMRPVRIFAASSVLPLLIGGLLLILTGLTGAAAMAWARSSAPEPAAGLEAALRHAGGFHVSRSPLPSWAARWPQAILVGLLSAITLWVLHAVPMTAAEPDGAGVFLGVVVIIASFPLLVAERHFASMPESRLPEAPALHALFLVCVIAWGGAGLVQIAIGLGVRHAVAATIPIAVLVAAVTAELLLRAVGRCFLPPPEPAEARAAISSLLASLIADRAWVNAGGAVRRQSGLDVSRSWALSYVRSALPHIALLLLLIVWGLSGVVLVGLDERGIYERFGAPVSVLHPGLHVILPWPMGGVRRVAFGTIHETALTDAGGDARATPVGAEDPAPPDADRLWEQPHPSELSFLIASATPLEANGAQQSFQVVSADIRLLYRIGLTDEDALRAAYRAGDPQALLRAAAGRVLSGFFAGRTLDAVLGENRETMAERLRGSVQQELTRLRCGIEVVGLVIEAIHPPAGAAEAYHNVQAAGIRATASIAAEQGRAIAASSQAKQYATDLISQAQGAAAETTGAAAADLTRFNADHAAAGIGGEAFMVDRYMADLSRALSREKLIIVDHRIPAGDVPFVDLRPPGSRSTPQPLPDRD